MGKNNDSVSEVVADVVSKLTAHRDLHAKNLAVMKFALSNGQHFKLDERRPPGRDLEIFVSLCDEKIALPAGYAETENKIYMDSCESLAKLDKALAEIKANGAEGAFAAMAIVSSNKSQQTMM
jgi:hypothetical protein